MFRVAATARAPDAIAGNAEHGADQDDVIQRVHAKISVSATSNSDPQNKTAEDEKINSAKFAENGRPVPSSFTRGWFRSGGRFHLPSGNQIGEQTISAGHAGGQLPEKHQAGIDIITLAVLRDEQGSAFERRFAGIMAREDRREMGVPLVRENKFRAPEPSRQNPRFVILLGVFNTGMFRRQKCHRRSFIRHAIAGKMQIIGSNSAVVFKPSGRLYWSTTVPPSST